MNIQRHIRRFGRARGGNIAMMSALIAVPMLGLLGGAIDLMRVNQMRAEIQGAIDAGVLALTEIGNNNEPKQTVVSFVEANLRQSSIDPDDIDIKVKVTEALNQKIVKVNASYEMKTYFLGVIGFSKMNVDVESQGIQSFEDVEIAIVLDISGSMNGDKFTNMQAAAKTFVNTVLTDDVKDKTTITIVPFSSNVNVGDDFWEFVKKSTVDNNHDVKFSDGHIWDGCVEFGSSDFDDSKPKSNNLVNMPRWYNTHWNPTRFCPESNNEVLYLSNTKSDLTTMIGNLSVSQSTSLDVGALVGLKALSPNMKGHLKGDMHAKHPASYDSGTIKILIFMTDGEATDYDNPNNGCDTVDSIKVMGVWVDCTYVKKSAASIRSDFTKVCNAAKAKGIMIYTIGFQISDGSTSDLLLEDCATTKSQYYFVETLDISKAFKSIAASINGVRLNL